MAEILTYSRLALTFQTPFPKRAQAEHRWSVKFNLSGAGLETQADADATALDIGNQIVQMCSSKTSWVEYRFYNPGSKTADWLGEYPPGQYPGTWAEWNGSETQTPQQLEVCVVLRCPVGLSKTGKPVFLRKFIHDVPMGPTWGDRPDWAVNAGVLDRLNNGMGPHKLVPIAPRNGDAGGLWSGDLPLYTRQLRGKHKCKCKTTTAASSGLLDAIVQGVSGGITAVTAERILELMAAAG